MPEYKSTKILSEIGTFFRKDDATADEDGGESEMEGMRSNEPYEKP